MDTKQELKNKVSTGSGFRSDARRIGIAALFAWAAASAFAQPGIPPEAVQQFNQTIGNRVEAVTIIGGDYGAGGGIYSFRGGTLANVKVTKAGGGGAVASPEPLGDGNVTWAPVLLANLGYIWSKNEYADGFLVGNEMEYEMWAVQAGAGARVYFTDHFSVSPTVSGIYGHVKNKFIARNPVGEQIKDLASGTFVDWEADTWTVSPGIDGQYAWEWGRSRFEFTSRFVYFHTESFSSSSPAITIDGDSETWQNKIDVDVPLGFGVYGFELHSGGFLSRTELFGGAADGLNENHVYTANGRLVFDCLGDIWKVRWVGLGASYFWGEHVNGWTAGIELRLQF